MASDETSAPHPTIDPPPPELATDERRIEEAFFQHLRPVAGHETDGDVRGRAANHAKRIGEAVAGLGEAVLRRLAEHVTQLGAGEFLRRWSLADAIVDREIPVYSHDEFAVRLRGLADFLEAERPHALRTGLPGRWFLASRWLAGRLARTWDLKTTGSPFPADYYRRGRVSGVRPWRWLRRRRGSLALPAAAYLGTCVFQVPAATAPEEELDALLPDGAPGPPPDLEFLEECDYDQASPWLFLAEQGDARLREAERLREPLLSLKIAALREGADRLEAGRAGSGDWLLDRCGETFLAEEAEALFALDGAYLGGNFRSGVPADDPRLHPGGLSDLLTVAGAVDLEIGTAAFSSLRSGLGELMSAEDEGDLRLADDEADLRYPQLLRSPDRLQRFDDAADRFLRSPLFDGGFWTRFRERLETSLSQRWGVRGGVVFQASAKHRRTIEALVQNYAADLVGRIKDGRPLAGLVASSHLIGSADDEAYVLRDQENGWLLKFDGRGPFSVPNLGGFVYLRRAINDSPRPIAYDALKAEVDAPRRPPVSEVAEPGLSTIASTGVTPPSRQQLAAVRGEVDRLRAARETAADEADIDEFNRKIEVGEQWLRTNEGYRSRPPGGRNDFKNARDAVQKAIKRALAAIKKADENAASHFDRALIRTPDYVTYQSAAGPGAVAPRWRL